MSSTEDSLEILLVKATNPVSADTHTWVSQFCDKTRNEFEGAQLAAKLLAYRIHSPVESEALNALKLLEECVKVCGDSFQKEIGKFRFLNEMIKLVSPKYFGQRTPVAVKRKVVELLYIWTRELKNEPKIKEAYDMLRKQNIVSQDPDIRTNSDVPASSSSQTLVPPPKPAATTFIDHEKTQLLEQLLKSKNPEDLHAANRLIKSMVKEDELRMERARVRQMELQTVESNIRLFTEMLDNMRGGAVGPEDLELAKELNDNCLKLRSRLASLVSETEDMEEALGEILKACDDVDVVMARYAEVLKENQTGRKKPMSSLDLLLDENASIPPTQQSSAESKHADEPLLLLEFEGISLKPTNNSITPTSVQAQPLYGIGSAFGNVGQKGAVPYKSAGLQELDSLSESVLREYLPSYQSEPKVVSKLPMNQLNVQKEQKLITESAIAPSKLLDTLADFPLPSRAEVSTRDQSDTELIRVEDLGFNQSEHDSEGTGDEGLLVGIGNTPKEEEPAPLGDLSLSIENVTPDARPAVKLLDNPTGLAVTLHLARERPRPDVAAVVLSAVSRYEFPVSNLSIQALVPEFCRLKLLPASSSCLPAFKPFLPPPAVTQIILIASTSKDPILLSFLVSFEVSGETVSKMCKIPNFHLV